MKIGCAAFNFTRHYEAPFEEAIRAIGELGFEGFELIVSSRKDMDEYYTLERIKKLVKLYQSYNLTLSEFVIHAALIDGLASFDKERKKKSIEIFKKGVKIAQDLGTKIVCTVSHWPEGLKAPVPYPPSYLYPSISGSDQFSPKLKLELPPNFSWDEVWRNYVSSMKICADIVKDNNMFFALESHTYVIVSSTDAYLRLFDQVNSSNIGANLDTGYPFIQREYVPSAIHKLKGRLFHVHIRDGDGVLNINLPAGMGIIDWDEVIKALEDIGYDGFLSFELSMYKNPGRYLKSAKKYLESILCKKGEKE